VYRSSNQKQYCCLPALVAFPSDNCLLTGRVWILCPVGYGTDTHASHSTHLLYTHLSRNYFATRSGWLAATGLCREIVHRGTNTAFLGANKTVERYQRRSAGRTPPAPTNHVLLLAKISRDRVSGGNARTLRRCCVRLASSTLTCRGLCICQFVRHAWLRLPFLEAAAG